jgi:hypothetical protein
MCQQVLAAGNTFSLGELAYWKPVTPCPLPPLNTTYTYREQIGRHIITFFKVLILYLIYVYFYFLCKVQYYTIIYQCFVG